MNTRRGCFRIYLHIFFVNQLNGIELFFFIIAPYSLYNYAAYSMHLLYVTFTLKNKHAFILYFIMDPSNSYFGATCRAWGARNWKEIRKKWEMTVKRPLLFYLCIPISHFTAAPSFTNHSLLLTWFMQSLFLHIFLVVLRGLPRIFLRTYSFLRALVHSFRLFHVILL